MSFKGGSLRRVVWFGFFSVFCFLGISQSPGNMRPSAEPKTQFASTPKYVFLISIDGWAYRHLWHQKLSMPNIRKLAKMGSWGDSRTVFPSMTWSSHMSLLTGVYPRKHGVLGNRWFERHKEILLPYWDNVEKRRKVTALHDLAHAAGMQPASLMWPGTQGSRTLSYNIPELTRTWLIKRYVKGKIKKMIDRSRRYAFRRIPYIMRGENHRTDKLTTYLAKKLILGKASKRPRLFLVHYLDMDHAQHAHTVKARGALARAAKNVDDQVGELIAATKKAKIFRKSAFVLVSDHGFLGVRWSLDIRRILQRYGFSRGYSFNSKRASREKVVAFPNGQAAFIYIRKGKSKKRYLALRAKILRTLKRFKQVERVYLPSSYASLGLPTAKEHKGSPDLIALARPNATFGYNSRGRILTRTHGGSHGYLPSHPDMWVPFVAAGAGIQKRAKKLSIRNVDIAPSLAYLLQLPWIGSTDGQIRKKIFSQKAQGILNAALKKKKKKFRRVLLARLKKLRAGAE